MPRTICGESNVVNLSFQYVRIALSSAQLLNQVNKISHPQLRSRPQSDFVAYSEIQEGVR